MHTYLYGRVDMICLVFAVGFAAKCVAVARDSHYRIFVMVEKQCVWTHRVLIHTPASVF